MHFYSLPFFGRVKPSLIRNGNDYKIKNGHNALNVFKEMFLQILRDYASLPDIRTLTIKEIVFFYDGLRGELKEVTKQH